MRRPQHVQRRHRREFLGTALSLSAAGLGIWPAIGRAGVAKPVLMAGEGVSDITPPVGIEMGGFHRPLGKERRIKEIRQPAAVRALVLAMGDTQVAFCSMDIAAIGPAMADRIRMAVAARTGIPAENVRLCATHTHSMPAFCYMRQWGAVPVDFMKHVEKQTVEAVVAAKADLAPAEVSIGKTRVAGGNHNRTVKTCPTDAEFGKESTDAQRWVDTTLQAMVLQRPVGKRSLLWYHFSAHAVCYADEASGPDWPGTVAAIVREKTGLQASFLQGHTGDVNPGDGSDWRGEIKQTTAAIAPALLRAVSDVKPVQVDSLRAGHQPFQVPFDMKLFESWREAYRRDPSQCAKGPWVDAGFAADWYEANSKRAPEKTHLPIVLNAVQLGPIGLVFHPAELYTYYGLAIRRDSPLPHTLVVGYTDDFVGYLPDPTAYQKNEYAALTVPKICDYPPFTPTAAAQMSAAALGLLKKTVGGV